MARRQGLLAPPDTWPRPILDLHYKMLYLLWPIPLSRLSWFFWTLRKWIQCTFFVLRFLCLFVLLFSIEALFFSSIRLLLWTLGPDLFGACICTACRDLFSPSLSWFFGLSRIPLVLSRFYLAKFDLFIAKSYQIWSQRFCSTLNL